MRIKIYTSVIGLLLTSCLFLNEETELIESPTGKYLIKAKVNKTDKNKEDYARVIIHVYEGQDKLFHFDSGASDVHKWALGWTLNGDTIVLQTSDIGDRAWIIDINKSREVEMTDEHYSRAQELKAKKYK